MQIVVFSNFDVTDPEELIPEESKCGRRKPVAFEPNIHKFQEYQAKKPIGLDIQNCELNTLKTVSKLVDSAFFFPELLVYLDVRCNKLESLDGVELLKSLKILYAHGNRLKSVESLIVLKELKLDALAIHGNPLVRQYNYKSWILNNFPCLKRLDFAGISARDRREAQYNEEMKFISLVVDENVVVEGKTM